jgi:hypothetical protein
MPDHGARRISEDALMLREGLDPEALSEEFLRAEPFEHVVIDDFLDEAQAHRLADLLEAVDTDDWIWDPLPQQVNKWSMPDPRGMPVPVAHALWELNQPAVVEFFEKLTGYGPLVADETCTGGGIHISTTGGYLDLHADFNIHPDTGLHRRLNALLFLNRDWDPSWNGQLELWDPELTGCKRSIEPIFNRLVVLKIVDHGFHGFPRPIDCPPFRRRISLATFYYSEDRPEEEKAPFHLSIWKEAELG